MARYKCLACNERCGLEERNVVDVEPYGDRLVFRHSTIVYSKCCEADYEEIPNE